MVSCLIEEHRVSGPAINNSSLELEGSSLRHTLGEGAAIETKHPPSKNPNGSLRTSFALEEYGRQQASLVELRRRIL
ncbi:hypothetical protein AVEN_221093-1 [Araneus ventricosus]|uniref:Uncharacterized protein n=1 Tax=Araneus ventricosus TaxID=182803 RepID=A0A4Y2MT04_ARAVE|nr:hypothetical protein AVEN_221093-1 [Araneus ventricosus]